MLWIALHLPSLSLESFAATLARDPAFAAAAPIALMDAQRLVQVNAAAQALGVKPGSKRATALALAPQITLGKADPARDALALEPVVHAALAFTPMVAVQPGEGDAAPHTVLLEVEASLRYFGGLPRLRQRLLKDLEPLGHRVHCASAPTAQGAALLARVHPSLHCADLDATARALDAAPVWLLGPGSEHWEALEGMGLRTLGDLRSLPRAGLARRFGEGLLLELDRALGLEPDPRVAVVLPLVFETRLELFARADTTEQVLHGASLLLARLVLWLGAQQAFVRRFVLVMEHEVRWRRDDVPRSTALEIALAEPSRDSAHLLVLLRERLAHLQLPAPTLDLRLHTDDIVRRPAPNQELFPTARSEREGLTQLIERLQARLGADQVQRLQAVEDHRPECGSRSEALSEAVKAPAAVRAASSRPPRSALKRPPGVTGVPMPDKTVPAGRREPAMQGRAIASEAAVVPVEPRVAADGVKPLASGVPADGGKPFEQAGPAAGATPLVGSVLNETNRIDAPDAIDASSPSKAAGARRRPGARKRPNLIGPATSLDAAATAEARLPLNPAPSKADRRRTSTGAGSERLRSGAAGAPASSEAGARAPGTIASTPDVRARAATPAEGHAGVSSSASSLSRESEIEGPARRPVAPVPVVPRRPTPRPVWLLHEPEPLPERQSRPLLAGEPLQLLSGPERIEAGWWDAGLAERDYFIAQAADGALVWIYRARLPLSTSGETQGWFMQGRFG